MDTVHTALLRRLRPWATGYRRARRIVARLHQYIFVLDCAVRIRAYQGRGFVAETAVFPLRASGAEEVQVTACPSRFESALCAEPAAILVFLPAMISKLLCPANASAGEN